MNSAEDQKLHFVLVPLMAQGHMLPMLDLARLLAERGALVSFITTPVNFSRIQATANRARDSGLSIRFVPLRFPCEEVGLPLGCENVDLIPSLEAEMKFFAATEMLREPLALHLRRNPPLPSCIVSDVCHPWTRHVARDFGVPRFDFYGICCFTLLCEHNLLRHDVYGSVADESTPVVVPGLLQRIEVTTAQAPGFYPGAEWKTLRDGVRDGETTNSGIIVNTFSALEPAYVEAYQRAKGQKTWTVGPLSHCNKHEADRASRGDKSAINEERCLSWLDSMAPRSVIYVSFGSLVRTPLTQIIEIGMGLEATQRPFIWVIKAIDGYAEVEQWLEEGFEERTKGRALIIRGWAPQVMILSHPSTGGFLTHCGWNSSLEGISAGVPMATWPGFADQFLNERLIVEVLRVGVAVGVKEPLFLGTRVSSEVVGRGAVEAAVNRLMGGGEEADGRRRRARDLGEMARGAMEVEGSSDRNLTLLIDEVVRLARK